jgi:hypothetical protein
MNTGVLVRAPEGIRTPNLLIRRQVPGVPPHPSESRFSLDSLGCSRTAVPSRTFVSHRIPPRYVPRSCPTEDHSENFRQTTGQPGHSRDRVPGMAGTRRGSEPNIRSAVYDNTTGAPGPTTQPPASATNSADNARERQTRATTADVRANRQRSA